MTVDEDDGRVFQGLAGPRLEVSDETFRHETVLRVFGYHGFWTRLTWIAEAADPEFRGTYRSSGCPILVDTHRRDAAADRGFGDRRHASSCMHPPWSGAPFGDRGVDVVSIVRDENEAAMDRPRRIRCGVGRADRCGRGR